MPEFTPTPEQQAVIDLDEGAYLVTAPPGSGKTSVLTQRIVRLLEESSGDAFRILALTFTTKAAEEMRERVERDIGEEWRRVQASTFHAFCLDVLQHYGERVGVAPNVTIYESDTDRLEVLTRGLAEDRFPLPRDDEGRRALSRALTEISALKRDLVPPEAAPDTRFAGIPLDAAYAAYDRTLRLFGAVDFDDLLGLTYRLFADHPRVAAHYRRIYRYVLIDEAQDMSRAQYELLVALLGDDHRNVLMVADADQSIYGFAGGSRKYLGRFESEFGATEVQLSNNFRCAQQIVSAGNNLIRHNPGRTGDVGMSATTPASGLVSAKRFQDEKAEAKAVAGWVERLLRTGLDPEWLAPGEGTDVADHDICVLARSRYALAEVTAEFGSREIEHQFGTGSAGLFESEAYTMALLGLRVLANPKDVMRRSRFLAAFGRRRWSEDVEDMSVDALFGHLLDAPAPWSLFAPLFAQASTGATDGVAVLDALVHVDLGLIENEQERELALLDQETLAQRWRLHGARSGMRERSLSGLLGELSLVSNAAVDGPGVRVLTIHAVKGLEFRVVILVGMNDGVFPDFRAVSSAEIEEERRNAYVAVTRASRLLMITRPMTRITSYGNVRHQDESRFVGEMGLEMKSA
jgi:DNA helicase-2/ATP-dependent DNA helicase PcrA